MLSVDAISKLSRWKVSLAVSFSAFTGYFIHTPSINSILLFTVVGVFLLASGASIINQIQEKDFDILMERTKSRPIPGGQISSMKATFIAIVVILSGSMVLHLYSGFYSFLLGLFNILWYNGLYTPLKRKTPYAILPGALTGAIPALIGWSAAGGSLIDKGIILLGIFIFIWQVPHFLILLIKYNKEYNQAGFKTINQKFSNQQIKRIIITWITSTSLITFLFPIYGLLDNISLLLVLVLLNIVLIILFLNQFLSKEDKNITPLISSINFFLISCMFLLIINKIL